jgi:hypothetical protein
MPLALSSLRALPVAALALACLLAQPGRAETAPPTLTVTGEASVSRAPDQATVSIGVTTTAETAAEALAQNSAAMALVIDRLKSAGIAEADLQTSGLSVNPNWTGYDSSVSAAPSIAGYTAANILTVRVAALDGLGSVLDAAVADGANTLNGLTFGLADPRPALDEARKLAVADAVAKATLLAQAAGVSLGDILTISEGGGYGAPMPAFKADAASVPVPVQQGEVSYSASVTIVWALAP